MEVSLGVRPHTGWAVAVVVSGDARAPEVHHRARLALCPDGVPAAVYHHAQELPLARAAGAVAGAHELADRMARDALGELVERARTLGEVVGVGLVGEQRWVPALESVVRSHALVHLAEGELYRAAIAEAAAALALPVHCLPAKATLAAAAAALGVDEAVLAASLAAVRARVGPPWQADHRAAAAVALWALDAARPEPADEGAAER